MEITVQKKGKQIRFELEGSLDIYTSLDLKKALEDHAGEKSMDVVVDMEKLAYIDSSGIGILIKALNYVKSMDSTLCVANLKPVIEKVFKVSGLTSYFEILTPEKFRERYLDSSA